METIISACGNDCAVCPRHLPKTDEELQATAELWHKIGYRDRVVSAAEIACGGCRAANECRYGIAKCAAEKGVANCGLCDRYPCEQTVACLRTTAGFEPACLAHCTHSEYLTLREAFFRKREHLDEIARNR